MKILVTGGAGFIGSHVVDAYVEAGHDVVVVDDLSSGKPENVNAKAKLVQMDIRDAGFERVVAEHRIEVISHHAAQMDVRRSVADPAFDASINVLGGLNVLEAARKQGVVKFIFASTGGAIYGEQEYFPADEQHPLRPLSPYGITKLATEKYLYFYKEVHGLNSVILRYANVYGPRQNPHGEAGVVAIFCSKILEGQQPVINGNGKQTRDYTFVGDFVCKDGHLQCRHGHRTRCELCFPEDRRNAQSEVPGAARPGKGGRADAECYHLGKDVSCVRVASERDARRRPPKDR